ncbi:S8 family peptidase [Bacillus thuringiensis]|uniref:S8 family peptidase n=1 Tax=Bacillus thuringiensis TaxID=1428 RepID=UPI000BFCD2C4|nr:S8 family peptidase [Bacillus thuringiensis]PGW57460.1 peptidase S8 [Bacillus thuringiensis]
MKNRKYWFTLLAIAVLVSSLSFVHVIPTKASSDRTSTKEDEKIIVKFNTEVSTKEKNNLYQQKNAKVISRNTQIGFDVIQVQDQSVQQALQEYRKLPGVDYVEPSKGYQAVWTPNDYYYSSNQNASLQKMQIPKAWDITRGSTDIVVAVVDSGVQSTHPDLKGKIISGYDYVRNNTDPSKDELGHGTHIAGTIAAVTDNGIGIAGIAPNVKVLSVRVLDRNGYSYNDVIANGITYAADHGAKVINLSIAMEEPSQVLEDAVNYAWNKGTVLIAGAGNSSTSKPYYPAAYSKVISVAATNSNDVKWERSNYGMSVDIAAPGVDIMSTVPTNWDPENPYSTKSGTSMATANVSGVAALLASQGLSNIQIRETIEKSADKIPGTGEYWKYGRVNAYKALTSIHSDLK